MARRRGVLIGLATSPELVTYAAVVFLLGVVVIPLAHSVHHRLDHDHGDQDAAESVERDHDLAADERDHDLHADEHDEDADLHADEHGRDRDPDAGERNHDHHGHRHTHGRGSLQHFGVALTAVKLLLLLRYEGQLELIGVAKPYAPYVARFVASPKQPRAPPG